MAAQLEMPWEFARHHYCSHGRAKRVFGNKCDFASYAAILQALATERSEAEPLTIFAAGIYDGADVARLVKQPWWTPNAAAISVCRVCRDAHGSGSSLPLLLPPPPLPPVVRASRWTSEGCGTEWYCGSGRYVPNHGQSPGSISASSVGVPSRGSR